MPAALAAVPNGWTGLTIFSGATSNTIGGTSPAARNILSGNSSYGLVVSDPGTSENLIQGNYFGLDASGTAPLPNYTGVLITSSATSNTLGGASAAARNIISGNYGPGLEISYSAAANFIQGNLHWHRSDRRRVPSPMAARESICMTAPAGISLAAPRRAPAT